MIEITVDLIDNDYVCRGCRGTGRWGHGRCAACNGGGGVSAEKARKNAEKRAERTREKLAAFTAAHPELVAWIEAGNQPWAFAKLAKWGSLFPDQVLELEEKRLHPPVDRPKATTPWVAGRTVVEGEIVSIKSYDSQYGSYHGLTVRQDDGRAVWFRQPTSLYGHSELVDGNWVKHEGVTRGDRVRVTLTLEPKADDPTFAIGKRPAKATILKQEVVIGA